MGAIKKLIDSIRYAPSTIDPSTVSYRIWIRIEIWDMLARNSNIRIDRGSLARWSAVKSMTVDHDDCVTFREGLESVIKLLGEDSIDYRLSLSALSTDIEVGICRDDVDLVCNMLEVIFFSQQTAGAEMHGV